jgi:DNA-binding LacI/PurR family transcriptional regulator
MRLRGSTAREFEDAEKLEAPMRAFLEAHRGRLDGLIGGDPMASLAVRLLRELGRNIPEDVAVIGGGTTVLATFGDVPLTSVNAKNDKAGAKAFQLLRERIEGLAEPAFRRLVNPVQLMVRASTRQEKTSGAKSGC